MTATLQSATVETFLAMARDAILENADVKPDEFDKLAHVKVTYGMGNGTYRGITAYGAWRLADAGPESDASATDFIEIAATGQESWIQLAGTLLHELGHSLAGMGSGHGKDWKEACVRLGFQIRPAAAGQRYWLSIFRPELRRSLYEIARMLRDGTPNFWTLGMVGGSGSIRPCRAGQGTRGGKSRGTGSGSRLRLWECACEHLCQSGACPNGGVHNSAGQSCKPVKVRVASDDFQATCKRCNSDFEQK